MTEPQFTTSTKDKKHLSNNTHMPAPRRIDALGLIVLVIGLAAFLSMGYMGYARFYKGGHSGPAIPSGLDEKMDVSTTSQTAHEEAQQEAPEFSKNAPDENALQGSWQAGFDTGRAFLQIRKGAFQLVYTQDPQGHARKYSRGTYIYEAKDGVLTLTPNREMGEPKGAEGVSYAVLTLRPYKLLVGRDTKSGDLFWAPRKEEGMRDQTHPLFIIASPDRPIRWTKSSD